METKAKPSQFSSIFPFASVVQNTEQEIVAKNIMVILKRTGDKFRSLSWKEYKSERLKDGNFSEMKEHEFFNKIQFYTRNERSARCFCTVWDEI